MKEFVFPYFISFGRNDSIDNELVCKLSNKDALRLENSAREGGRFRLDEDDAIGNIYKKVYEKIIKAESDYLLANPEIVENWLSWEDDYDPDESINEGDVERYLEEVSIGINYPRELQCLDRTLKPRRRKKSFKSIILSREEAKAFLLNESNKTQYVVYVDDGETLYWVPLKYSGTFIISSNVRKVEKHIFSKRNDITEIIIEDGLEEIGEEIFLECRGGRKSINSQICKKNRY